MREVSVRFPASQSNKVRARGGKREDGRDEREREKRERTERSDSKERGKKEKKRKRRKEEKGNFLLLIKILKGFHLCASLVSTLPLLIKGHFLIFWSTPTEMSSEGARV